MNDLTITLAVVGFFAIVWMIISGLKPPTNRPRFS